MCEKNFQFQGKILASGYIFCKNNFWNRIISLLYPSESTNQPKQENVFFICLFLRLLYELKKISTGYNDDAGHCLERQ